MKSSIDGYTVYKEFFFVAMITLFGGTLQTSGNASADDNILQTLGKLEK